MTRTDPHTTYLANMKALEPFRNAVGNGPDLELSDRRTRIARIKEYEAALGEGRR